MSKVLVVGDLHAPATHPGYLAFCQDIYDAWDCNQVVFIGDVADWHRVSRHVKNADAKGAGGEFRDAKACLAAWYRQWPTAHVLEGNHDKRIIRAAWDAEIPDECLKGYNEVWGTPKWTWHQGDQAYLTLDDVFYTHGTTAPSNRPALSLARMVGQSVVCGHHHKEGGIGWISTPQGPRFGMDVGCGIDDQHPAMRYGLDYAAKSILSCGVVIDGQPYFEIMPAQRGEAYHRNHFR